MTTATMGEACNFGEADLLICVPHLRAFARSLTGQPDRADDLVQDTVVRALSAAHQFQPGTNLKAWMFTILRNLHYGELRRNYVRLRLLDDTATPEPTVLPNQEANLEVRDFRRAFRQLGDEQREVLMLVGASGLSYEEAAKVCDCPTGTIKSRVSRARRTLLWLLESGPPADEQRDAPRRPEDRRRARPGSAVASTQPSMPM
jgi:RNA polymerase sigma-70 factor (ECF subfamily)